MLCSESTSNTALLKVSCAGVTGQTEPRGWTDTGTERESEGEGKLHAWFCRQNESPSSARMSSGAKGLIASGFITAGLVYMPQINP